MLTVAAVLYLLVAGWILFGEYREYRAWNKIYPGSVNYTWPEKLGRVAASLLWGPWLALVVLITLVLAFIVRLSKWTA